MTTSLTTRRLIVVATGGPTMEAEGTQASTDSIVAHLSTTPHSVSVTDVGDLNRFIAAVADADLIFNAVHGRGGEDGGLHFLCELAAPGVPITGPVGWVHALAADKEAFKAFATNLAVPVPPGLNDLGDRWSNVVDKPRFGGGSHGVLVRPRHEVQTVAEPGERVIEAFIDGRSVTACVYPQLAEELPLLEITPSSGSGVYSEADKRGRSEPVYSIVEPSEVWAERVWDLSTMLYGELGGRGPIRFDWVIDHDNPWLLEANTNPGWRPLGNMGRIVSAGGHTFTNLIDTVLGEALAQHQGSNR